MPNQIMISVEAKAKIQPIGILHESPTGSHEMARGLGRDDFHRLERCFAFGTIGAMFQVSVQVENPSFAIARTVSIQIGFGAIWAGFPLIVVLQTTGLTIFVM